VIHALDHTRGVNTSTRYKIGDSHEGFRVRRSSAGHIWRRNRDDGKRFVVHADEKLTAFVELESAIRARGELP
jgi:hypothetical protein